MESRPVVLLPAFVLLFSTCLLADSDIRSVRLSFVQGNVLIAHGTGKSFEPARRNMPVTAWTRLRTGNDGLLEIEFENGSTVRLTGDTEALVEPLKLGSTGSRISGVMISRGTAYLNFKHDRSEIFYLDGANLHMELDKNVHLRMSVDGDQVIVAVFKGKLVDVKSGLKVGKNHSFKVDVANDTIVAVAKRVDLLSTDAWDEEMDRQQKQRNNSPAMLAGYVAGGGYSFTVGDCYYWPSALPLYSYWMPYCMDWNYYPYEPAAPPIPVTPPGNKWIVSIGPRPLRPHRPAETGVVVSVLPNTVVHPPIVLIGKESVNSIVHRENRPSRSPDSATNWSSDPTFTQNPPASVAASPARNAGERPARPSVSGEPRWTAVTPSSETRSSTPASTHSTGPQMPPSREIGEPSRSVNVEPSRSPEPRPSYSPPPSSHPAPAASSSPSPAPSPPPSPGASSMPTTSPSAPTRPPR